MVRAHLQRIAAAVPENDIHQAFVQFAAGMLRDPRARSIFLRLASKSEIHHRYSCLQVDEFLSSGAVSARQFYASGNFPSTAQRMRLFEQFAPILMRRTLDRLALTPAERSRIGHVIVTCCTGFYAPGLDYEILDHLGLPDSTERTMIGFMGCYAAINALKFARHFIRSQPDSLALVVNLELCTLHFHETQDLNEAASFLLFSDGCSAAVVGAEPVGFEIDGFAAMRIENSNDQITWRVGDLGFDMYLSGHVPTTIAKAMKDKKTAIVGDEPVSLWAVHPGGKAILDAVASGMELGTDALQASRQVLSCFGNMSSATVMFVLEKLMRNARQDERGCAMSFGPGLTAEVMRFHAV